ncbi:hypothetical protein HY642_02770 [Candidatus Woesearchaeota archaeon]|nr:hypothetical protein [Candidatus Woesearchaeota archaeon]
MTKRSQVTLIGCFPDDLLGRERLSKTLQALKPNIVSVEYDIHSIARMHQRRNDDMREGLQFLEKCKPQHYGAWRNYLEAAVATDGYEYDAAQQYAAEAGITSHLLRNCSNKAVIQYINPHIGDIDYILSQDASSEPDMNTVMAEMDDRYDTIKSGFDKVVPIIAIDMNLRSRIAAEVRENAKPDKMLAHVCGAYQLRDDSHGNTLYAALKDLQPTRILINS